MQMKILGEMLPIKKKSIIILSTTKTCWSALMRARKKTTIFTSTDHLNPRCSTYPFQSTHNSAKKENLALTAYEICLQWHSWYIDYITSF